MLFAISASASRRCQYARLAFLTGRKYYFLQIVSNRGNRQIWQVWLLKSLDLEALDFEIVKSAFWLAGIVASGRFGHGGHRYLASKQRENAENWDKACM